MSDNNADFNGAGQINNPTSGDATQADFGQSYDASQSDAQMYAQETQLDTSLHGQHAAYAQSADYGQQAQPSYDQPNYGQSPYAQSASPSPSYDSNAGSYVQPGYNQYAQPDYGQPAYGQQPSYDQPDYGQPAPSYDSSASSYSQYAQPSQQPVAPAPAYDPNGAYGQPAYGQPSYGQPNYGQQGYSYNQSAYTQQPAYGQPVPMGYSQKSKLAAGLLGIFLGCFGVHNFYLGNTGKAVAQLLLTVIGWIIFIGPAIASIWGLVEGIMILASHPGSQWHRDGKGVELQD